MRLHYHENFHDVPRSSRVELHWRWRKTAISQPAAFPATWSLSVHPVVRLRMQEPRLR